MPAALRWFVLALAGFAALAIPGAGKPSAAPRPHGLPDPSQGPSVNQERTRLALPGGVTRVRCDGDGRTGQRLQVLYVRAADRPDRFTSYLPFLGGWAVDADR